MPPAPVRLPTLASDDREADRGYRDAAQWVAEALALADVGVAAALGRLVALAAPGRAGEWARAAVEQGEGGAAVRLLDAHLAEGGHEGLLAEQVGGQRLLEAAEESALSSWGADPRTDRDTAALLGGLYWRLDPTDSYLFASRWDGRAAALSTGADARTRSRRGGRRDAVAEVLRVWEVWFGLGCDAAGWHVRVPARTGPTTPAVRCLGGVARREGGPAEIAVVRGSVQIRTAAGNVEGRTGERLAL